MKILITGSDGLIGRELYNRLSMEHEVIGVDKHNEDLLYRTNSTLMDIDIVIHCAANCLIRKIIEDPFLAYKNLQIDCRTFEFCRQNNIPKIVYFSSSRVEQGIENPYTAAKKHGELLCKAYKETYGLDYMIVRPETVWGPGDKTGRVINKWIKKALHDEDIVVYGGPKKCLPPIRVDKYVEVFLKQFDYFMDGAGIPNPFKVFVFQLSVEDIIKVIKEVTDSDSKVVYEEPEEWQPQPESYVEEGKEVLYDKALKSFRREVIEVTR